MHLGIDVSKHKLDCCLLLDDGKTAEIIIDNHQVGYARLRKWLQAHDAENNLHICMEYTGIYYEQAADYFSRLYTVSVVNPYWIKSFGMAVFKRSKTDKQDAKLIAQYSQMVQPEPWKPLTEAQQQLRDLNRYLIRLKRQRAGEETKRQTAPDYLQGYLNQSISHLNEQIKMVNQQIKQLLKQDEEHADKIKRLQTIPGIGLTSAAVLFTLLQHGRFNKASELVAYLGLDPRHRQSGSSLNKPSRISKFGQNDLRAALFMPAMVAYRDKAFPAFIERLKEKKKPPKVIIVALMRKLAVIAFHLIKTGQDFEPERYQARNSTQ
ncbi:IS110 family transposase [Eikenella sp. S3360]|uniref:IS110 family transposase n=1 Tax=Eikenella glucosivorans TaxID=2766967 RepID=A0ABS0NCV6_9NEIS|nr:IS110 family transposase [Eikenella glucosivorans]MBH5330095.1 IS110 family transposase [Eikenella glucosivorans]